MATFDQHKIFAAIIVLFNLIKLGTPFQCYSCSSGPEEICDDIFSIHAHQTVLVKNCESSPHLGIPGAGPNTHCGKTKKFNNKADGRNHDYVFRGCVPENYCRLVKSEVSECSICETERCNSSSILTPSWIFGVVSFIIVKLLNR